MPLIATIGRRSAKTRMLIGAVYLALLLGAVSMVYPFMLMISGSTKSGVDAPESVLVPGYLADDTALYRKDCEAFFNESLDMMRTAFGSGAFSFKTVELPVSPNAGLAQAWEDFLEASELPFYAYTIAYVNVTMSQKTQPSNLREFKTILNRRFNGDLAALNAEMDTYYDSWNSFYMVPECYLMRREVVKNDPIDLSFREFKAEQPFDERYYFSVEGYYKNVYLRNQYSKDIESYNREHDTAYTSWADIHLPRRYPAEAPARVRQDWESFVRDILNLLWIRVDQTASAHYRTFLQCKYQTVDALNRIYGTKYNAFGEVALFGGAPEGGVQLSDWTAFVQGWKDPVDNRMHRLNIEAVELDTVDFRFREYLKALYGTVGNANAELGTRFSDWIDFVPPQEDFHYQAFMERRSELKREYSVRNYLSVLDFIVLRGRAIINTAIYCVLAILAALIINPLAAYGLSRYRPSSAYKILLFLMLTMAFPPLVTMIPQFLMLREFGLLNTFAALVLPGMANGYSIFLLKGFFDSLPRELYESAEIDGAGEFTIFWRITMSLSKPILAVIALNAFNMAYSNFMMALLICQDQNMWTLMPWLFQLQQNSGQGVIFASLLIAAIPTFVIFVFCQNVIMRGIVVPVEK